MQTQRTTSVNWIQEHSDHERLESVLNCFSHRGIATIDQIEVLTGLTNHPVRDAVKILANPMGGLPPLLSPINIVLPGQRGRSLAAYLLTASGSQALGQQTHTAPMLTENVEAAHALMEMKLFIAAQQTGNFSDIEEVIFYEYPKNIRVDVLINNKALFEIEQCAGVKDIPRITDKVLRLSSFFKSPEGKRYDSQIRILFALNSEDKSTVLRWQSVLSEVQRRTGQFPFEIYWQEFNAFMDNPSWEDISQFHKIDLNPGKTSSNEGRNQQNSYTVPDFGLHQDVDVLELKIIMELINSELQKIGIKTPSNRGSFFEMMQLIYNGSHFENGPVERVAAFPILSLQLLHRFLRLDQNRELLPLLQDGFRKIKSAQFKGIVFFRNTLTQFYWDIFLRYFSFGRNGPLKVSVVVPGLDDDCSELRTRVWIGSWELLHDNETDDDVDRKRVETATAWVFDALYLYAQDMGLIVDNRTKGKSK